MIENGWIFPDGTEFECGNFPFTIHDWVVKKFIEGLKLQDLETQKIIQKEIEDLFFTLNFSKKKTLYSDYAISRLGWIKVGTSIWHDIKYAGYDWQTELVKPYEDAEYRPVNMCISESSYLHIKCDIRLAIMNG